MIAMDCPSKSCEGDTHQVKYVLPTGVQVEVSSADVTRLMADSVPKQESCIHTYTYIHTYIHPNKQT